MSMHGLNFTQVADGALALHDTDTFVARLRVHAAVREPTCIAIAAAEKLVLQSTSLSSQG
jgi:hypothetical protein